VNIGTPQHYMSHTLSTKPPKYSVRLVIGTKKNQPSCYVIIFGGDSHMTLPDDYNCYDCLTIGGSERNALLLPLVTFVRFGWNWGPWSNYVSQMVFVSLVCVSSYNINLMWSSTWILCNQQTGELDVPSSWCIVAWLCYVMLCYFNNGNIWTA